MKILVTGRHVTITDAVRASIGRKLQRFERLLHSGAVSAQCIIAKERETHVCELTVHARGDHLLHAVGRDPNVGTAVGAAIEKVAQQAARLSDRWKTRRRTDRPETPERAAGPREDATEPAVDQAPRVIRTRPTAVKPMSVDDAALEFAADNRPFLIFRDAASERLAMLYRRADGHFGLIDLEAGA
jgi:putative sigma-54 modulation protein